MKNNLYYPKVSLSDEDIFLEIKKEREIIGYYSLPNVDTTVLKTKLDDLNFPQKQIAIIGRYILTPDIFDIIRETKPGKGGEIQITDALLTQAKNGMVLAYKFKGERFDCGSIDGFVKATNYFYDKSIKNEKKEEKKDNGKK